MGRRLERGAAAKTPPADGTGSPVAAECARRSPAVGEGVLFRPTLRGYARYLARMGYWSPFGGGVVRNITAY